MFRRLFATICVLSALSASGARAEPAQSKPAAPVALAANCERESTAIGRSACLIASSLQGVADAALVVAAPASGDERVSVPASVTARLAQLVAARLGAAARSSTEPL